MKKLFLLCLLTLFVFRGPTLSALADEGDHCYSGYGLFRVMSPGAATIDDDFFSPRREQMRTVTLPSQWEQLEDHHHVDNFRVAAGEKDGVHFGMMYFDSDLYKWMEASAYALGHDPGDEALLARMDEITGLIESAQMDDGYLNT